MNLENQNIEKYQANIAKLTFTRMIVPVRATDCKFLSPLDVNGNAPKKVVFVVKRYAVRKPKIRPLSVHTLKMKQYAVRKGASP